MFWRRASPSEQTGKSRHHLQVAGWHHALWQCNRQDKLKSPLAIFLDLRSCCFVFVQVALGKVWQSFVQLWWVWGGPPPGTRLPIVWWLISSYDSWQRPAPRLKCRSEYVALKQSTVRKRTKRISPLLSKRAFSCWSKFARYFLWKASWIITL